MRNKAPPRNWSPDRAPWLVIAATFLSVLDGARRERDGLTADAVREPIMPKLAINGGEQLRTKPFPKWPVFDETEEQAVAQAVRTGCGRCPRRRSWPCLHTRRVQTAGSRSRNKAIPLWPPRRLRPRADRAVISRGIEQRADRAAALHPADGQCQPLSCYDRTCAVGH